jgi:hypothetical protein
MDGHMNRSLPFVLGVSFPLMAACADPPPPEGAAATAELSATAPAKSACTEGTTAVDFSASFSDGTERHTQGCFAAGDDWLVNGHYYSVTANVPDGSLLLFVRLPSNGVPSGPVLPGPGEAVRLSYTSGATHLYSPSAKLEVAELHAPSVGGSDGVLAGTVTAHLKSSVDDLSADVRIVLAARGIREGQL